MPQREVPEGDAAAAQLPLPAPEDPGRVCDGAAPVEGGGGHGLPKAWEALLAKRWRA